MKTFSERNIKPRGDSIDRPKYKIFTVVLGVYHPGWLHFMVLRFGNGYNLSRISELFLPSALVFVPMPTESFSKRECRHVAVLAEVPTQF